MKKTILVLALLCLPNLSSAQIYQGRIIDGSTKQPIPQARIQSGQAEALSDASGVFTVDAETPDAEVVAPGFRKKQVVLEPGENLIELFDFNVHEMGRFVVKAGEENETIRVSKHDLSAEMINQATAALFPDVMKVVQMLPGVTTNHEMSSLLFVRGGDPDEVLAILDDMIIIDPYMWGGMISVFNPKMVDKVSFRSGGFSAEWPQAMSGILDVKNKTGNPENYKVNVDLSATTLDIFAEGPFWGPQDSSFIFGFRRTHYDLMVKLFYDDKNLVFPYFYDGQLKLAFPLDDHLVTLNAIYSYEGMRMTVEPEEGYASENAEDSSMMYWDGKLNVSLASDYKLSESLSVLTLLGVYYNQGEYNFDDSYTPLNMEKEQVIAQLRHAWTWEPADSHRLKTGLYLFPAWGDAKIYWTLRMPTGSNTYYEETIDEHMKTDWISFAGWFAQDEITLIPDLLFINPSVNLQYYTPNSQPVANPRVMLKLQPLPDWEITLATGLYSQYPLSAFQIDEELGNPDLIAEEARHYIAGTKVGFAEGFSIEVDGYYKDYDNLIVSDADPDINFTNNGEGYAYGVDVMLKREIGGKWDGWLSYSWIRSRRRINGRTDPESVGKPESTTPINEWYTPSTEKPNVLNLVLNYNFTARWKLALTQKYAAGGLYTPIVGGEYQPAINEWTPVYGKFNSERYPDYWSTDIKLTLPFTSNPAWSAYVQVTNLLDNKNVNSYQYKNDYSGKRAITQLPRMFIGGLAWEF